MGVAGLVLSLLSVTQREQQRPGPAKTKAPKEKIKIEIGHHARTRAGIGRSASWHALHRHCSQLPMRYAEPLSHGACRHQELVVNEGYTGGGGGDGGERADEWMGTGQERGRGRGHIRVNEKSNMFNVLQCTFLKHY